MYQNEIEIGKTYTNGMEHESLRKVIAFVDCDYGWVAKKCVRYQVIKGPHIGLEFTVTKKKFAQWAWREVFYDK